MGGLPRLGVQVTPGGDPGPHLGGCPGSGLGGVQAQAQGDVSQHVLRQTHPQQTATAVGSTHPTGMHSCSTIFEKVTTNSQNVVTCVTAAGLRAGNTRYTFVTAGVGPAVVRGGSSRHSIRYGDEYYFSTLLGGHALTSQEGGGPCSLGTFDYEVVGHLAFRLT